MIEFPMFNVSMSVADVKIRKVEIVANLCGVKWKIERELLRC